MKYKAYIFDFDYTLGDSTTGIVNSVNYALVKLGYKEKNVCDIRNTIGFSLENTYEILTQNTDKKEAEMFSNYFKEKADEIMVNHTQIYPEVESLLMHIKENDGKIGILTTKFHYRIVQILLKYRLEQYIDVIIGAEDVRFAKPNPEGILLAVKNLNVNEKDILYIGDSLVDANAALNAQVDFAGVLTGMTKRKDFEVFPAIAIMDNLIGLYNY